MKKIILLILLIGLTGCTKVQLGTNDVAKQLVGNPKLALKVTPDKVIDSDTVKDKEGDYVRYAFVGKKVNKNLKFKNGEKYSNLEPLSDNTARVYLVSYSKETDGIHEILFATTTPALFESQMNASVSLLIKHWLFGYPVNAAIIQSGLSGHVDGSGASWTAARDSAGDDNGTATSKIQLHYSDHVITRILEVFDTSSISPNTVASAVLKAYANTDFVAVFADGMVACQGASGSNTALANGDFHSNEGATQWSNTISTASWSTNSWQTFTLNASGVAGINTTGYTKISIQWASDNTNSDPGSFAGYHYAYIYGILDAPDSSYYPYLDVTYAGPTILVPNEDILLFE